MFIDKGIKKEWTWIVFRLWEDLIKMELIFEKKMGKVVIYIRENIPMKFSDLNTFSLAILNDTCFL